jgi:hypothetical protein
MPQRLLYEYLELFGSYTICFAVTGWRISSIITLNDPSAPSHQPANPRQQNLVCGAGLDGLGQVYPAMLNRPQRPRRHSTDDRIHPIENSVIQILHPASS